MRMSEADWDVVLDTNLKGRVSISSRRSRADDDQAALRAHHQYCLRGGGLMGKRRPGPTTPASKARSHRAHEDDRAARLASRSITCNAVAPGFITTDHDRRACRINVKTVVRRPDSDGGKFGRGTDDIASRGRFPSPAPRRNISLASCLTVDGGMVM